MLWAEQYTGYIPFCPKASPLSTSLTADTQGWVEGREETAVMNDPLGGDVESCSDEWQGLGSGTWASVTP